MCLDNATKESRNMIVSQSINAILPLIFLPNTASNQKSRLGLTLAPFSSFRIQIVGIQSFGFFKTLNKLPNMLNFVSIDRISRDITEVRELQMQSPEFGQNAGPSARPAVIFAVLQKSKSAISTLILITSLIRSYPSFEID